MNPIQMTNARNFVRNRAPSFMTSTCTISRPKDPTFDINTGTASGGTRTTIYTGVCRVWEVTGPGVVTVGEDDIIQQTTNISIPWDTDPVPIRGDYIKIETSATDDNMVDRLFEIIDMAKSGELRATRRFSVQMVQEKVDGRNA